jgi:hypothetical protein
MDRWALALQNGGDRGIHGNRGCSNCGAREGRRNPNS